MLIEDDVKIIFYCLFINLKTMKITEKNIKEVELETWKMNTVLELLYTHRWEEWKILIRDYIEDEKGYKKILKQLRVAVRENYDAYKIKVKEEEAILG